MKAISKFINRRSIDLLMFGWVTGIRKQIPAATVEQTVKAFSDYYGIEEDQYPIESMKSTFFRMNGEMVDFQRSMSRGK